MEFFYCVWQKLEEPIQCSPWTLMKAFEIWPMEFLKNVSPLLFPWKMHQVTLLTYFFAEFFTYNENVTLATVVKFS